MIDREEIIETYRATGSLKRAQKECGVSYQVIRRILASVGVYTSEFTETINRLHEDGVSVEELSLRFKISEKAVISHLPHTKGSYAIDEKTANAIRIQECRKRKKQ